MGIEQYRDKKVFISSSDSTGCGYYRTFLPHRFLSQYFDWCEHSWGFPSPQPSKEDPNVLVQDPRTAEADVIWLQRANHEFFQDFIPACQAQGKKVIFDLDDNMWEIPTSNLAWRHYPRRETDKLNKTIACCDLITVSTVPMWNYMHKMFPDKKFVVIPNHLPHWEHPVKVPNERIKLGWAGSYTHAGDFTNELVCDLREIKKMYKDRVELCVAGWTPQWMKPICDTETPWIETKVYQETFAAMNWDIGLIVAANNEFNRCKSNLKFLEYSQTLCASIAHSVYPYTDSMEHGVDSFLIQPGKEKKQWLNFMVELIEDEEKRLNMAHRAYDKVQMNYTYEYDKERLEDLYTEIFDFLYKG